MFENFLNLVFPPRCIFCGSILDVKLKAYICSCCTKKIPFAGKNFFNANRRLFKNGYCDEVICVCEYSGIVKQSLIKYKFFEKSSYYRAFATLLSDRIKKTINHKEFDIVMSVPLYKYKECARGYNQSFLISKVLSKDLDIYEGSGLLKRIRNTGSQSRLAKNERYTNIKDAFRVNDPCKVKGKSIILCDDILTTGNTIEECCKVLKEAGALKITAAVIASGRKF